MAKRKTEREQRAEWETKEAGVWERFSERLAAARTFREADDVISDSPPEGAPGRRFYSNLAFFLRFSGFGVPGNATERERGMYLGLLRRMDEGGELKPGALDEIVAKFRTAKPGPLQYPF